MTDKKLQKEFDKWLAEMVKEQQKFCHCPGPTCSGCEPYVKRLIVTGALAAKEWLDEHKKR